MIAPMQTSKESIRGRMIKHALNYWNIKNAEDLDPVVKLLLEALSSELYSLGNEIKDTESRILEKISGLLAPDLLTCPRTAHALMHADPVEPSEQLKRTDHFYTQTKISNGTDGPVASTEVYFTPAAEVTLFDVQVKCIASKTNIFLYNENSERQLLAHGNQPGYENSHTIWIGVQASEQVKSLAGLSFCFDWKNVEASRLREAHQLLALSRWSVAGKELKTRAGLQQSDMVYQEEGVDIFGEYDPMHTLENDVSAIYNDRFIQLEDAATINDWKDAYDVYPSIITNAYAEAELKKIPKRLYWISVSFPVSLPLDLLQEVDLRTNCFPAMNRQLNEFKYRLKGSSNIIPLKLNHIDQFLAVKSLTDEKHSFYNLPLKKMEEDNLGSYSLRTGGIERFDIRNAKEYINYLLELLRSESSAFALYGYDFVATTLREMNQRIALMEQKTGGVAATSSEVLNYIKVKPFEGYDLMFVEYWTTLAEAANQIKSGSRFQAYRHSKCKADSLYLLTGSSGGKDRLKQDERLGALRYGLMTRDRIVSKNDIQNFCYYELGNRIRSVQVGQGIVMSSHPKQGFHKTIDITLTPAANDKQDKQQWDKLADQLLAKLQNRSGMGYRYRVIVNK